MKTRLILTLFVLISFLGIWGTMLQAMELRKWTDKTGKHQINAEYISSDGISVTLKKSDGNEIKVLLELLSVKDRAFVRSQVKKKTAPKTATIKRKPKASRKWKLKTGRTVQGYLARATEDTVFLRRTRDGKKELEIPLAALDDQARAYVEARRPLDPGLRAHTDPALRFLAIAARAGFVVAFEVGQLKGAPKLAGRFGQSDDARKQMVELTKSAESLKRAKASLRTKDFASTTTILPTHELATEDLESDLEPVDLPNYRYYKVVEGKGPQLSSTRSSRAQSVRWGKYDWLYLGIVKDRIIAIRFISKK